MRFLLLILIPVICLFSTQVPAEITDRSQAAREMHALFDAEWERQMAESPVWASMLGDRRYNRQWTDISPEARAASHEADKKALAALGRIDREELEDSERINYQLFELQYQNSIESYPFNTFLMPISQRGGIQTLDELGDRLRMTTTEDYDDWLERLNQIDTQMAATINLMKEGIAKGIVPPKILMERVPPQIEKQIVDKPEDSLFYKPFTRIPDKISGSDKKRLQASARKTIENKVIPAYRELLTFFTDTYLPACRETIGASDLPNGKALYEFRVRQFTTTDYTPDEIHKIGLREVARNRKEMEGIVREVGFKGDINAFNEHLRTDPKFYYENSRQLFEGYLAVSKKIDPLLVNLFGKLPRMPYGIKAIPDAIAPDTTTAYYTRPAGDGSRAGYFYVNLYKPETRPKWEMEVLTVHEAVPGHHLQIALQQELEQMPNFRRYSGFTVFIEGWGLYSERLGYDLGLYKDPYSRYGQLTYDMWRAVRLVVDTGMHHKGWSRQKAIDYFKDNAPRQELDIINEIDRYISWPGQALAYKMGQLKLLELREKAEKKLGKQFDIRAFHDLVLGQGAVPLSVLEDMVNNWIASQ